MASEFSHALVAVALGRTYAEGALSRRFWGLAIFCSIFPDVDVFGYMLGVDYGHFWGHRGFTHSLSFALLLSLIVVRCGFPEFVRSSRGWRGLFFCFFLVTASHGFLDAMTDGGLGVAFFAPFDDTRYFLPWRPIKVSPIGLPEFLTAQGWEVLVSEFLWIWLPVGLLFSLTTMYQRLRPR
jgi:inner membrane protein